MNHNSQNDNRRQNGTQSGKLRQYIAEAERNARLGAQNEIQQKISAAQAEAERRQRVDAELERIAREGAYPPSDERPRPQNTNKPSHTKAPERVKREPIEEIAPFLGYYPLAGRTTYIGQHKKKRRMEKIFAIAVIILVILVVFVIIQFGGEIAGKLFPENAA